MDMFLFSVLSSSLFRAFNPASWKILGYNSALSAVTRSSSLAMSFKFFVLFIKSFESFTQDHL